VDEEQLLDHLDLVRLHLPVAFRKLKLLSNKKEISRQNNMLKLIQAAEARTANEMDIIQGTGSRSSKKRNKSAVEE